MKIRLRKVLCLCLITALCLPLLAGCAGEPKAKEPMRVLMIGNSFCFYFVEELCGMAAAAGIPMQLGNLYYKGCRLDQHWEWLQTDEPGYQFYLTDAQGRRQVKEVTTLRAAVDHAAWDVITLQDHFCPDVAESPERCIEGLPAAQKLLARLRELRPKAKEYFHTTWAYQVGYVRENGTVPDSAAQERQQNNILDACARISAELGLPQIPGGQAWAAARKHPLIGDILSNKGPNGDDTEGDRYHDGTTGGGQYLNACVWFETLTGQSCIGNPWRPTDYEISEERIQALQQIAHDAVAASR